jgi:hypothetical protein
MKIRQIYIAAGVIAIGALPELYVQYRLHAHNWRPLDMPVVLRTGNIQSTEFTTDLTGTYVVSLAFKPNNFYREDCLVGDVLSKESCEVLGSGLDFNWTVVRHDPSGDHALFQYQDYRPSGFESGAGELEADIGRFEAQRGGHYIVMLGVRRDSTELNAASPKLRVEAHRIYWEDWLIYQQMAFVLAIVVGLFGVVIMLFGFMT